MRDASSEAPTSGSAATEVEAFLQRLDWMVVRRLDGLLQGDYRSLFTGHGYDLAEVREYQPEDDVRYMDWNVTARMSEPYVRQYIEERDLTAWFLLDVSPSIAFGTAGMSKRDLLERVTGVISRLLTRRGNRVGAILFGGGAERLIPPGSGQPQALRLMLELRRQPRLALKAGEETDLGSLLARAGAVMRRRSLVFVVSDYFSAGDWERSLLQLGKRHETVGFWLGDPRERELPAIGPLVFEDAETGEQIEVDTSDRGFRARFEAVVRQREERIRRGFARAGADLLRLDTSGDLVEDIYRFMQLRRESRRRLSRGGVPA